MRSLRKLNWLKRKKSPKFINPYYKSSQEGKYTWNASMKVKLIVLASIMLSMGLFWFMLFSAYFKISDISVVGTRRVPEQEILRIANSILKESRFFVASKSNIFLYNTSDLKDQISDKYYMDSIEIFKKVPNEIEIILAEKDYSAIWREGDNYFYIDERGRVIERANPLEIKKNYPLIDNAGAIKFSKDMIVDSKLSIEYVLRIFSVLRQENPEIRDKLDRFLIDETNTIKLVLLEGPYILFDDSNDLNKQIVKMITIINEKIRSDFFKKEYIDLRYGDRVYYR